MNTIIIGLQWGDEGKGKIVDYLTEASDVVIRGQGGNNAGHTVIAGGTKYVLHLLPSGILWDSKTNVIGNGVVIDPIGLVQEIERIEKQGVAITPEKLLISDRAHVVMPFHKELDAAREVALGDQKIGTTKRGIGPAYADKVNRCGLRIADFLDRDFTVQQITRRVAEANETLARHKLTTFEAEQVIAEVYTAFERLRPHVCNTIPVLHAAWKSGKKLLFEGAQGTLLDIDFGTYPFVTSSNPIAGAACVGAGVGPTDIDEVWGIVKAYATRVGSGPFPTELHDETGEFMTDRGHEYGTTTGRRRRCGWLDLVALKYAVRLNRTSALAMTKLDVLAGLDTIRVAVRYRSREGAVLEDFPYHQSILHNVTPEYEDLPGFDAEITDCRSEADLPAEALDYIRYISEFVGVPIALVGVGPGHDQNVWISAD